ncbi:maleylpyruvate isomerase family mycothiol-dependent enzyme [Kibdelosporangium lantanae]
MKDTLVKALTEEWASIDGLLAELPADEWARDTSLPGWSVQDVVSHIIGAELGLAGEQPPVVRDLSGLPHVRNNIAAVNELWVDWLRAESPAEVLKRFRTATANRAEILAAMTEDEFAAESWTPSGKDTYGRYMRIRLFDCWMHEQDIREAVDRAGNADGLCAELSIDEITAALGYVVGKKAGAPQGTSVTFALTGPVVRDLHVLVDGRAQVVAELRGRPPRRSRCRRACSRGCAVAGPRSRNDSVPSGWRGIPN